MQQSGAQPESAAGSAEAFQPHYKLQQPLSSVLQKTDPARDVFPTEITAAEIGRVLLTWREALTRSEPDWRAIDRTLNAAFKGSRLSARSETVKRSDGVLRISERRFDPSIELGAADFVAELSHSFRGVRLLWAEFELTAVETSGLDARTMIRYELVSTAKSFHREQRTGWMELTWTKSGGAWDVTEWRALNEQCSRSASPMFEDITEASLAQVQSFSRQLARGTDYWRTVLDGACGIDIYGNYGVAAGDFDNDGRDDLYICQPAGLPNLLYRNRGDGTFEDVTEHAGVGVLDSSPGALFADVDNDGRQDLIVVRGTGPLLFLNQGGDTFRLKPDAFRFAGNPQGSFTGAAIADYDRDGWLDVYFCLYSYYQGPDRYRYPAPYYNAENGPPNFLFRNNRDGTFADVTRAARLDRNNHRFSFACGWCDYDQDGWPDLYVANDFGQKNLYHNNGDGTFTDRATEAGVLDTGAGMSVCWLDYDNDSWQDLYVADMWSAAGLRLTGLTSFMEDAPRAVRELYRKHSMGNSLFRNDARGAFTDESAPSETSMGRWAWSSDAWDFDHDGYPDIYIATGMISGPKEEDLSSFFWRRVVAQSPAGDQPAAAYEEGWNAINELIRADGSWSGRQRNVLYANHRDGTFSDVSGAAGLDCIDDSRSFALADIDNDGRQELIVKNRTGPQVRIFRNVTPGLGHSISIKLTGRETNRDAIGASITIYSAGRRQTKFVQAGSGFLAQHSKQIFFGLGDSKQPVSVTVRWPNGKTQQFENAPPGHCLTIEEGAAHFLATPYTRRGKSGNADLVRPEMRRSQIVATVPPAIRPSLPASGQAPITATAAPEELPHNFETWLIAPIEAPGFELTDLSGKLHNLRSYQGRPALLNFWASNSPASMDSLTALTRREAAWRPTGLQALPLNVDEAPDTRRLASLARRSGWRFPVLLAAGGTAAVYNLLYRYTFDRRRDIEIPTSFLLDEQGMIVKIYRGPIRAANVTDDLRHMPRTAAERQRRALPFPGQYYGGPFARNYFTYGVAFAEHGYARAAETALLLAIRNEPQSADAYYDLGTLYMREQKWDLAEQRLLQAVQLKPDDLMAYNNLGVTSIHRARPQQAEQYFQQALKLDPLNVLALGNLADLYRTQGRTEDAQQLLQIALKRRPDDPTLNYKLAMVFAGAGRNQSAQAYLEKTLELQPDNPQALDNLGVVYALTGQMERARKTFSECIQRAPTFDQAYLNLARVDVKLGERAKARDVLRALLRQVPNHPLAEKYLQALDGK
ncbi:MAG: FG-GAP-like repeat-containing protein [Terriglobia bacterium]